MKPAVHPVTAHHIELALDDTGVSAPTASSSLGNDDSKIVYCDGDTCRATWHQAPLAIANAKRRRASSKHYCSRCFANLKGKPEPLGARPSRLRTTLFALTSRQATLTKYLAIISDTQEYLWLLALTVVFWPLVWAYYRLWLARQSRPTTSVAPTWHDQLHWILAAVSHFQCGCCHTYMWLMVCMIVVNCEYEAQAWFWALLEAYTVYLLLVNIIHVASPIYKSCDASNELTTDCSDAPAPLTSAALASSHSVCGACKRLVVRMLRGLVLTLAPIGGIAYVEHVVASVPNTFLVATADTGTSVETLLFVDANDRPLAENPAPVAFATNVDGDPRLQAYQGGLQVALGVFVTINTWLMLSWVTNVWPSQPFPIPVSVFKGIANNINYNVSAIMSDIWEDQGNQTYSAVWNLQLNDTPSVSNGLPLIYLQFFRNEQPEDLAVLSNVKGGVVNPWGGWYTSTVTLQPIAGQRNYSFEASFSNFTSDNQVRKLSPYATSLYEGGSLAQYLRSLPNKIKLFPTFLLVKHCYQMAVVAGITGRASLQIWRLWLQFDLIATKVDLTQHRNLQVWYRFRCRVVKVVNIYTQFIQVLLSMTLLQLVVAVGGLFFCCLRGNAPLPGYFLLILTVFGSLSTLIFLLPLAKALDVQANHESLLHRLRLQLQLETNSEATNRHRRIGCLARLATKIRTNDDRIRFWGIRLSTTRLIGLAVSIGSAISFVFTRKLEHPWNEPKGTFYDPTPFLTKLEFSRWKH